MKTQKKNPFQHVEYDLKIVLTVTKYGFNGILLHHLWYKMGFRAPKLECEPNQYYQIENMENNVMILLHKMFNCTVYIDEVIGMCILKTKQNNTKR